MNSGCVLDKELEAYEKMKQELLEKYRGKVVAVLGGKLVDIYDNEEEAYADIIEKYGLVPVLIKRAEEREHVEYNPAYVNRLLDVVLVE